MRSTTRPGSERGQSAVEYLAVIVLVGVAVAALFALRPGIPAAIAGGIERVICTIVGTGSCGTEGTPPLSTPTNPYLTPAQIAALDDPATAGAVLAALSPEEIEWLRLNDPATYEKVLQARSYQDQLALATRLLNAPLDEFLAYRDSPDRDERLDWTTDLCSAPLIGSTGISFDFRSACIRHDFGYRNSKRLGVFEDMKRAIDDRFLEDMKAHCRSRSIILRPSCYKWAYTFYAAVRAFG
jgi:Prokaryotic phospholipase A2